MSTNSYDPKGLGDESLRVNPYGQNPASIPRVRITPSSSMEEIHAAIRTELEPLGEIVSMSDENVFSGKFGAPGTMLSRPEGIKVKIKFTNWIGPLSVFVNWNPTLDRFEYYNRMQRQITLRPQQPKHESEEIFRRLQQANDTVTHALKGRGFQLGLDHLMVGGALAFLPMLFLALLGKDSNIPVINHPAVAATAVGIGASLFFLCILTALRDEKRKKEKLHMSPWPNMSYAELSKNDWQKNPFGIIETLFRDEDEKHQFIEDLTECAATAGIRYLGRPRTHELVQDGKVGGIISGELTFPSPTMTRPVIVFDGEVNGPGDKQLVAWDGQRFFYAVQMDKEAMNNHMARFGIQPDRNRGRRNRRRRGKHISDLNVFNVAQVAAVLHISPPLPNELFPA